MQEINSDSFQQPQQTPPDKEVIELCHILGNYGLNPSENPLQKHIALNMRSPSVEMEHLEEEKDKIDVIQASSNDKLNFSLSSPLDHIPSNVDDEENPNLFDKTDQNRQIPDDGNIRLEPTPGAYPPLNKAYKSPLFPNSSRDPNNNSSRAQNHVSLNNGNNNLQNSQPVQLNGQQQNNGYNDVILEPFEVNGPEEAIALENNTEVIESVVNLEVKERFKRIIGYSVGQILIFALMYLTARNAINIQVLIGLCMIWPLMEIKTYLPRIQRGDYRIKSKQFKYLMIMDWVYLTLFILLCTLKLSLPSVQPTFAIIPGFLSIVLYLTAVSPPPGQRFGMVAFKLVLFIQALLIGTKFDDRSKLSWGSSFFGIWVIAIIFLVVTCFYVIFFSLIVYSTFKGRTVFANMSPRIQIVGIFWYFLVSGTSIIYFMILVKFVNLLDGNDSAVDKLERITLGGLIYSVFILAMTFVSIIPLKGFIRATTLQRMGQGRKRNLKYMANFEVTPITRSTLFTIVSQTYFVTFEESLTKKNKADFVELKRKVWNFKNKIFNASVMEPLNREKVKEQLMETKVNNSVQKAKRKEPLSLQELEHNNQNDSEMTLLKPKGIAAWTVNDLNKVQSSSNATNGEAENDNLCFICCVKKADAVYLDCGHAGICLMCAQESWKKHNNCVTCRKGITKVAKVEMVKGMDIGRVVYTVSKAFKTVAPAATAMNNSGGNGTAGNIGRNLI